MKQIDARGKQCPVPVIMTKKQAEEGSPAFVVLVDDTTAVENLKRFGANQGYQVTVTQGENEYQVNFQKEGESVPQGAPAPQGKDPGHKTMALLLNKEQMGTGDLALGNTLMDMFFFTLDQDDMPPDFIVFVNSGVKIPVFNEKAILHLRSLEEKGAGILVCGTCLKHYELTDRLQVGTVSNMYDILHCMKQTDKVVTL